MVRFAPKVDMSGKVVLITGANTGIGYIAARDLSRMGAHLILAGRSQARLDEAITRLKSEVKEKEPIVEAMTVDLASFKSIREFADNFKAKNLPLHVLLNNAGVMAIPERRTTEDGLEMQIGTNHFGHFLLTNLLLDTIKSSAPARIVNVSSEGHRLGNLNFSNLQLETGYSSWGAYGNSKLANILFSNELQHRLEGTKVTSNALHPGYVATELARNITGITSFFAKIGEKLFAKTPEQGAQTSLYLTVSPDVEGVGGKYFSDCRPANTNARAQDAESGKKLWEISEQVTGLVEKKE